MTWIALHEDVAAFKAVLEGVSIFGHKTWTLFNDTKVFNSEMIYKVLCNFHFTEICSRFSTYSTLLSLSKCSEDQFTCGDGHCLTMIHRCDGIPNCEDGSDEEARNNYCKEFF